MSGSSLMKQPSQRSYRIRALLIIGLLRQEPDNNDHINENRGEYLMNFFMKAGLF